MHFSQNPGSLMPKFISDNVAMEKFNFCPRRLFSFSYSKLVFRCQRVGSVRRDFGIVDSIWYNIG